MSNLKSSVYKEGERPACPYCKSVQVKAMSKQPKKYPEPKMYWHSNKKEVEALKQVWNNGYDCKKCGHEFIALKMTMTPSWEANSNSVGTVSLGAPKKKSGFFGRLIKYSVIFIIALIVFSIIIDASKSPSEAPKEEVAAEVIEPETIIEPEVEEDPLGQEFSQEAEEAAHTPYFDEPTSIENSADQNDTLSIKTTLRAENE